MEMKKRRITFVVFPLLLLLLFLLNSFAVASAAATASHPTKLVSGFVSNVASLLLKRLWSLKPTTKSAAPRNQMLKFENGYVVETVFDGSKLGIEPHSVEVTPSGELLLLDSINSNVYRIALPLSRYSRPKLIAGSPEGYAGHADGRSREVRFNHPRGITMDDRGNIYVADAMNNAIRKISDAGVVTTIAGGRSNRGGHVDGPSEDAKFSDDFEVRYVGSSCSLLVVDRGNQAVREIQLNFDDCAYQYETGLPLGVALLLAAAFFGYMLALLQRRVGGMVSQDDVPDHLKAPLRAAVPPPYQKPMRSSARQPLITTAEDAGENEGEEGFFRLMGKLLSGARSSAMEILRAVIPGFRKKLPSAFANGQYQQHLQHKSSSWPVQESYSIPADETPPPVDNRTPNQRKQYAFMSKEPEKIHHIRQARPNHYHWDGDAQQQQQYSYQQHLQHHRHHSLGPQTFYEQSCEATKEIVFGAVQEVDSKRRMVEIKAVNYGDAFYEQYGVRHRNSSSGNNNNNGYFHNY